MSTSPDPQSVAETEPPASAGASTTETGAGAVTAGATAPRKPRTRAKAKRPTGSRHPRLTPPPAGAYHHIYDEKEGFFQRFGVFIGFGIIILGAGAYFFSKKPSPPTPPAKQERIVMIAPLPPLPPPPPPPPPPKQKPPEEKMEKEAAPSEVPKEATKPEPVKAAEPAPLGTNLKGNGPGMSGLGTGSGLGGGVIGGTGGNKGGSRFGWYAGQVQSRIAEALRKHPKTKNSTLRVDVRIWPDTTGRITRAQLASSTGDSGLDDVIQNSVLNGLQLQEPPPAGMKLPIVLRMTARRPN